MTLAQRIVRKASTAPAPSRVLKKKTMIAQPAKKSMPLKVKTLMPMKNVTPTPSRRGYSKFA